MKTVVFRVDSGSAIGIGHLMRCLVLAEVLEQSGYTLLFICRPHKGSKHQLIEQKGYHLHLLSPPSLEAKPDQNKGCRFAGWLGCSSEQDASETEALLKQLHASNIILCIDHYAVDYSWSHRMRPFTDKIIVIDDLIERKLDCDLIINQSPGVPSDSYTGKVPQSCNLLTGSNYALINPCFRRLRDQRNRRAAGKDKKTALIAFGGGDPDNLSKQASQIMTELGYSTVIIATSSFSHLEYLEHTAQKNRKILLHIDLSQPEVAQLINESDIAIGAAGGGALERCCLGLPTITLATASNQLTQFQALSSASAIIPLKKDKLTTKEIREILNHTSLDQVASAAAELIDGEGVNRIVKAITDE